MSRFYRPVRVNIYTVSDELDTLIQSFHQRFELQSDREAAGYVLLRLTDGKPPDREIECVVRSYMRRLAVDWDTATGQLAYDLAHRVPRTGQPETDCWCCPGEAIGRLFEDVC